MKSVKKGMALEDQNTIFPGFGRELNIEGSVPIIYDASITGFRAAATDDYLVTVNAVSGSFGLFTGSVAVSNFPSNTFTPTISTVTGAGNVSGKHYVDFIFSSNFSGTIQSSLFLGSSKSGYTFPLLSNNNTYGTISYSIPSGSAQLVSF